MYLTLTSPDDIEQPRHGILLTCLTNTFLIRTVGLVISPNIPSNICSKRRPLIHLLTLTLLEQSRHAPERGDYARHETRRGSS